MTTCLGLASKGLRDFRIPAYPASSYLYYPFSIWLHVGRRLIKALQLTKCTARSTLRCAGIPAGVPATQFVFTEAGGLLTEDPATETSDRDSFCESFLWL